MTNTTITNSSPLQPIKGWLYFLPFYLLLVGAFYHISSTIFTQTVDAQKYFDISFSKEQVFNQSLFFHLSIAVSTIAIIHLLSAFTGKYFSLGRTVFALLLIAALVLFILGINLPLIKTTKFYFFKENYSLIDVLSNLKGKNEMLLYWTMLIFTFVVPLFKKMALAYEIFFAKNGTSKNIFLSVMAKWAMVDVLVIAILISCMKSSTGIIEMTSSNGLIYFASSTFITLIITTCLSYVKLK